MIGLWSEHFPPAGKAPAPASRSEHSPPAEKTPTPAPALAPPIPGRQRCFICPTCDAVCRLLTSSTADNPDRKFYKCPSRRNCFKWADEVKSDDFINVPNCGGCAAGVCRVRREKTGPNAGRILFMCRVKEGEGSCGYRVWQDELGMLGKELPDERVFQSIATNCTEIGPANTEGRVTTLESAMINCDEIGPTNTVVVEETRQGDRGLNNESPVIDTSQHCECLGVTSVEMGQFNGWEENRNESSSRPLKRSRYEELKGGILRKISSVKQIVGCRFSFHFRSLFAVIMFYCHNLTNSLSIKHSWKTAAMEQDLGTQLHGWWGRLAFHPMHCVTTHISKSFTFHVSSLDLLRVKIPVNSSDSTTLTSTLLGAESYVKPPSNPEDNAGPSGTEPVSFSLDLPSSNGPFHETGSHNVVSESISKTFNQAAELVQNNLLALLETMDVKDHEAMSQAAESTFAALDGLLFDHQDFKKRAVELIHHARSLAQIEQSMPTIDSCQQLVNHFSSQRRSLDKINHLHAKAVDDVMSHKTHLIELQEEVRSTSEWIFQIQAELSCLEDEMSTMEHQLDSLSETKDVLEGRYLIMSKELEDSHKHYERKEAERSAAKAAFDRAKASLRG